MRACTRVVDRVFAAVGHPRPEPLELVVGGGGEHLPQAGARGGHAERVAVVGAHQPHVAVRKEALEVGRHADRAGREAAREGLGDRDDVRISAEPLGGASGGDRQAGLHLVEDQHDPVAPRERSHGREVAGLWQVEPAARHRALHQHGGRLRLLDAQFERGRVVEGNLASGDFGMPVVGAGHLDQGLAARRRAGELDRRHVRLGAGVRVAPEREAEAPGQLLGDGHRVLGGGAEMGAERRRAPGRPRRSPDGRGPAPSR